MHALQFLQSCGRVRTATVGVALRRGALLVIGLLCLAAPAAAGDGAAGGGMRMYVDPETGVVGVPPPAALSKATESLERAQAPESGQLTAEPVTVPAGGMKVNLHGRFQAEVKRRADSLGPGVHECVESGGAPQ